MMKGYCLLLFVLIALGYSFANTEDCPNYKFQELHRCLKYDGARQRQCTDAEVLELVKIAESKHTGSGKPRLTHSVFFFDGSTIFNKNGGECTAKKDLMKQTCTRPDTNTDWTCRKNADARPIHLTRNGHYIGDA